MYKPLQGIELSVTRLKISILKLSIFWFIQIHSAGAHQVVPRVLQKQSGVAIETLKTGTDAYSMLIDILGGQGTTSPFVTFSRLCACANASPANSGVTCNDIVHGDGWRLSKRGQSSTRTSARRSPCTRDNAAHHTRAWEGLSRPPIPLTILVVHPSILSNNIHSLLYTLSNRATPQTTPLPAVVVLPNALFTAKTR